MGDWQLQTVTPLRLSSSVGQGQWFEVAKGLEAGPTQESRGTVDILATDTADARGEA